MITSRLNANFRTEQIIPGKYHLSVTVPGDDNEVEVIDRQNLDFLNKLYFLAHVQKFTENIFYERLSLGGRAGYHEGLIQDKITV